MSDSLPVEHQPKLGVLLPAIDSLMQAHDAMRVFSILKPQVVVSEARLSPYDVLTLETAGVEEIWYCNENGTDVPGHTIVPLRAWWDGDEGIGGLRHLDWGGLPTRFHLAFPDEPFSILISDDGHLTNSETLNIQKSEDTRHDQRIVANDRAEWLVLLAGLAAASHPEVVLVGELPTTGGIAALDDACAFALRLWYVALTSGEDEVG